MSTHLSLFNLEKKSNDITCHTFFNEKNYKIPKLREPTFHREIEVGGILKVNQFSEGKIKFSA